MQHNSYPPELVATYNAYAASLGPTPKPEYPILHGQHPLIQVPAGHLPIKIAQFSRGDHSDGRVRLHHWAIFIPTSARRGVGNFYEIGGSLQTGYFNQQVVNNRHLKWDKDERGSHLVGWVAPSALGALETHFSLIPIQQGRPDWNCQTWIVEALRGLNQPYMYAVQMDYAQCFQQMAIVEKAWDVGDA
ncbi:hypothetical protein JVT61DRAFT_10106 [Boletus reticuloceps]|uniref:Uncharacterized protein n=1 Tax=Boletus reticuloceps TaxID=495285 RepID=A0A8I2YUG8_9AGAM|nr:hypothetical protein JVT61DRAFT_10106 [Boletus reticuloceps]